MPSGLDQAEATRLMNASWGKNGTYLAPTTPIRARLMSANGSASAAGTEVTNSGGSAYASQDASAATPVAVNGVITSNLAITFTNMPAATIVGIELWDSAGTPRRIRFGSLTASKTTALGDSLTIASGSLVNTLGGTP